MNLGGYVSFLEGDWEPWFAWHPVSTKEKTVVWLKTIQRRKVCVIIKNLNKNLASSYNYFEHKDVDKHPK